MDDLISRQAAMDAIGDLYAIHGSEGAWVDQKDALKALSALPSAQPDYTEMRQEFLRMASYIDVLLECTDEQKETLIGFISRLSEYMPWTERD